MSNRKRRTATSDFLYYMAREGKKFFDARTERDVLLGLEKDGLVERKRTQARDPQGTWKGDRRRNTYWEITDKGWRVLSLRGSSNDQRMRVHQNSREVHWSIDRYVNRLRRPAHEVISEVINYPEPGSIATLRVMGQGPSRRRGPVRYRRAKRRA